MPFAARRRHQYWISDVRYLDYELRGRDYVVSVMDNHSRCILSSALTCSQDLSSYLTVLYAAVERYVWPTLGECTTMHTGPRCKSAR
jgi:putative transposase